MNKKIGIGAIAAVSAVAVVSAVVKAFDEYGRKNFYNGFDIGKLVGDFTTAEHFSHKQAEMRKKYDSLCKDYDELESNYHKLMTEYNEILDYCEDE
ncbi:MAG: hypothetical protein J6I55_03035 [Ruminococcus sp.]|nr:hypothetical protein [Ruminococcus sp.]